MSFSSILLGKSNFLVTNSLHKTNKTLHVGFTYIFREFHHSPQCFKRRSGSKALDPHPRSFSKKQMKRKQVFRTKKIEVYQPKVEKLKERQVQKKIDAGYFEKMIDSIDKDMFAAVRDAMLPDGYIRPEEEGKDSKLKLEKESFSPDKVLHYLRTVGNRNDVQQSKNLPKISKNTFIEKSNNQINPIAANRALVTFAKQNRVKEAQDLILLMQDTKIELNVVSYTSLIAAATREGKYADADRYFDEMVKNGIEPSLYAWTAYVNNKAKSNQPDEALKIVDRIIKIGIKVTAPMFVSILQSYIHNRRYQDANELWLRMHEEEIEFTRECFAAMIKLCTRTKTAERALFYVDEMKSYKIDPDISIFAAVFRACAEAPHWVKGYESFIYDAMLQMEGCEIMPTTEIYNSIIYAFGKAGNPIAAEFYFWEMRRKGLHQNAITYNNLLFALWMSQSVGAERYGRLGTFVKRPLLRPTKEQEALMTVGTDRVNELISRRYIGEEMPSKEGREKHNIVNAFEGDEEAVEEEMMAEVEREAKHIKFSRDYYVRQDQKRLEVSSKRVDSSKSLSAPSVNRPQPLLEDRKADMNDDAELQKLLGSLGGDMSQLLKALNLDSPDDEQSSDSMSMSEEEGEYESDSNDLTADDFSEEELQKLMADLDMSADQQPSDTNTSGDVEEQFLPPPSMRFPSKQQQQSHSQQQQVQQRSNKGDIASEVVQVLDGESSSEIEPVSEAVADMFSDENIDKLWDLIEFGKPPKPDHSMPFRYRQQKNITRAELVLKDMERNKVKFDHQTLNHYLAVYTEAVQLEQVDSVMSKFKQYNISPDAYTFKHLIRMYVRGKNLDQALACKSEATRNHLVLEGSVYGILIETLTHRDMLVEAIKLFEETTENKIKIPERHLRILRNRCKNLRIRHPDMPADPNQWVKDVRQTRKKLRYTSDSRTESIRTAVSFAK